MAMLLSIISKILVIFIYFYQFIISPLLGPHCRFKPTCSQYSIEAIHSYYIWKAFLLILKRVLKCHPLNPGGEDPLPLKAFDNREY